MLPKKPQDASWSAVGCQIQIGETVITQSLLTESLNEKLGVVMEYNECKERYAVQFAGQGGQPKLLRGANLRVIGSKGVVQNGQDAR
eukprot:5181135-Karenia_brevis.AAC.1